MKLLIDMNLSPLWSDGLAREGFEAVHWSSIGKAPATDAEIMEYAEEHGFTVLTHDLDFSAILAATSRARPSVVQIRAADPSFTAIGVVVVSALRQMAEEIEGGALITVDPRHVRARILPFPRKSL
jgi:predicted nuclease of predicted toxin-antitoxin system